MGAWRGGQCAIPNSQADMRMCIPHGRPRFGVPLRAVSNILVLVLSWAVFVIATITARFPEGRLVTLASSRAACLMGGGGVGILLLVMLLTWGLVSLKQDDPLGAANYVLAPLRLLSLLPLIVFVLHPARVPIYVVWMATPAFLFILAVLFCLGRLMRTIAGTVSGRRLVGVVDRVAPARLAWLLFAVALVVYTVGTATEDRRRLLVGDERHYMLLMESLKRFHSVDMTHMAAYDGPLGDGVRRTNYNYTSQSRPGRAHSVHHIGLPLVMVLPHALAGYRGVIFLMNLVAALLVANMFLLSVEMTDAKWASAQAAFLFAITGPLIFYFRAVYPDMPAALLAVYVCRLAIRRRNLGFGQILVAALAVACLPWLHVKFLAMSGTLALLFCFRRPVQWQRIAVTVMLLVISGGLMMGFFYMSYGSWLPNAQYGHMGSPISSYVWRGTAGLLLDRDHGLVAYSPYLLLVPFGLIPMLRQRPRMTIVVMVLTWPSFLIFASHWMWWGGPCPPCRFALPVLPFACPFVAAGFMLARRTWARAAVVVTVAVAVVFSVIGYLEPAVLTSHGHGGPRFFPGMFVHSALPKMFYHWTQSVPVSDTMHACLWGLLGIALLMAGWRTSCVAPTVLTGPVRRAGDLRKTALGVLGVLMVPGLFSFASACLASFNPDHPDVRSEIARLTFTLRQALAPIERKTGMTRSTVYGDGFVVSARLLDSSTAQLSAEEARAGSTRWVRFGPWIDLYPGRYDVTYDLSYEGTRGEAIVVLDVAACKGRKILAKRVVVGTGAPARSRETLSVLVDRCERDGEFRCCMVGPGSVELHGIEIIARVGSAADLDAPR
jgi:hypothetical protein